MDYAQLEKDILQHLKAKEKDFAALATKTPRVMGEVIEDEAKKFANKFFGTEATDTARSMADAKSSELAENYLFDIKTKCTDRPFSMPNITSIKRLADLYQSLRNHFVIIIVHYSIRDGSTVSKVQVFPVEWISWKNLSIGQLGWGQLQLKNPMDIQLDSTQDRIGWYCKFCRKVIDFYENERQKGYKRQGHFRGLLAKLSAFGIDDEPTIWDVEEAD